MGNALLQRLEATVERDRLEESPTAPALRKIFRSWNSTDLWTGLRRYWNEFPKRPEYLSYGDMQHVLCLEESEAMFLWDTCSNTELEQIHRNDMFGSICLYCGSNTFEKTRFLLALFDTNGRGLISLNQLHDMVFSALCLLGKMCALSVKPKDVRRDLQHHLDGIMDRLNPEASIGFEALAKTLCDTRDTLAEDGDFENDLILGLIEVQEIGRCATSTLESSFIGKHHSAIENPKRKSPSLRMTNAPSRDFDKEIMEKQKKAGEVGMTGGKSGGDDAPMPSGSEGMRTPRDNLIMPAVLEEEWICVTLSYPDAKSGLTNPSLVKKLRREICSGLACNDSRLIIQYIGQGVIHLALGGKRLSHAGADARTAAQLVFVFGRAMQSEKSTLRKGLLKEAHVYNGMEIAEKQVMETADPSELAKLQPREEVPATPTGHGVPILDAGTPSDDGLGIMMLPLRIEV
ncbi:unnamed protein product [Amoebophrya sp. A25]|nr:unnamed protein product [Amoebophrya sp. A25]|eukprot:GSA25T00024495001.1